MKNFLFLTLYALFIPIMTIYSQSSTFSKTKVTKGFSYHRLFDYGTNLENAKKTICENIGFTAERIAVNIKDITLDEKKLYLMDIGSGVKYYYVDYSYRNGVTDYDSTINAPIILDEVDHICAPKTFKYHKVRSLGTSREQAIRNKCSDQFEQNSSNWKLNINTAFPLKKDKIYLMNFGRGLKYYKVLLAANSSGDPDYELDDNQIKTISFVCNTEKYHKVYSLGHIYSEARSNFCNNNSAEDSKWKLNITTETPLTKGKVYRMDFGRGLNYYQVELAADSSGDSDYDIHINQIDAVEMGCYGTTDIKFDRFIRHQLNSECSRERGNCQPNEHYIYNIETTIDEWPKNWMSAYLKIRNDGTKAAQYRFYVYLKSKNSSKTYNIFSNGGLIPPHSYWKGLIDGYLFDYHRFWSPLEKPPVGNYTLEYELRDQSNILKDKLSFNFEIKNLPSKSLITSQKRNITIYNLSGILIKEATIDNQEQESSIMNTLPKGLYIVKNGDRTYKVVH